MVDIVTVGGRRRLDRLGQPAGLAQGRPAQRRRRSRADLLRHGRDRADRDRRQPRARTDPRGPARWRGAAGRRRRHERVHAPRQRLGLGLEDAASGVLEIASWNQTHGIRQVTIERGRDPRAILPRRVRRLRPAPRRPGRRPARDRDRPRARRTRGTLSAFGLLVSDIKRDLVRTLRSRRAPARRRRSSSAPGRSSRGEGRPSCWARASRPRRSVLRRVVDARYLGEAHEVKVPAPEGPLDARRLRGARRALPRRPRAHIRLRVPRRAARASS